MNILQKCLVAIGLLSLSTHQINAQANYWNFSGTYFNCNSGAVSGTTPSAITDQYPDAFYVPGICNTYYRVYWSDVIVGSNHYNTLIAYDVSSNTSGHPFSSSGNQYNLVNDGVAYEQATVAVGPLGTDNTRKIYGVYGTSIRSWTVNANGTISAPTTLYTYSGGAPFDSRTPTKVSSDGKYLLINTTPSASTAVIVFDLTSKTPVNYPSPVGARITGYEYIADWSGTPRIYLTYNNMWANPTGVAGFGYYTLGNTGTFNGITTPPAGTDIRGFGFTDIEKAKNGRLYLVYNPTLSTGISSNGTLYSYSSSGAWSAVSGLTVFASNSSWNYPMQTQIDGENYDAAANYYPPSVVSVFLNSINGGSTAATAPTILNCPGVSSVLSVNYSNIPAAKLFKVTLGTISGGNFVPNSPAVSYSYSDYSSSNNFFSLLYSMNNFYGNYIGALKIECTAQGICGNQVTMVSYFNVQDATIANPLTIAPIALNGINGSNTAAAAPTVLRCPGVSAILNVNYSSAVTAKSYKFTLGTISGGNFVPNSPLVSRSYSDYSTSIVFNKALSVMDSTVGKYNGALKIECSAQGSACGNTVAATNYFIVQDISVLAEYLKYATGPNGIGDTGVVNQDTAYITTSPPVPASNITTFKNHVDSTKGYMGANRCGIWGIHTHGNWSVSVYQVDDSVGNKIIIGNDTAPVVSYIEGHGNANGTTRFNDNALAFDGSNPPFYVDATSAYGDGPYFSDFYTWARMTSVLNTNLAPRTFCVELKVEDSTTNCIVSKKTYFKIAINGTYANGSNAKPGRGDDGDNDGDDATLPGLASNVTVAIYPNPVNSVLTVVVPAGSGNASIQLTDNAGRGVYQQDHLQRGKNTIDTHTLPAGVYFYSLSVDGKVQHGKIVKQ